MSRFVRASKYRHVFAKQPRTEDCFLGIKLTKSAWDSNYIAVNPQFAAVCWQTAGGGACGVFPVSEPGKLDDIKLIAGHKAAVLDVAWNPFNDNILATASEDCKVKIWNVPDGGLKENLYEDDSVQNLQGHGRKVGSCNFNPVADNILATTSTDYTIRIWDIESGSEKFKLTGAATNIIQSVDWNMNGSLLAQLSKDKKIRVIDPRQQKIAQEGAGHEGVKGGRLCWLGTHNKIFSVGFSRSSQRQYCLWDPANLSKPILPPSTIDSSSGVLMPFFDNDTSCLFVAGKGDGNIRYYEIVDDNKLIYYLSEYKSNKPARGAAVLPKRAVDVNNNEILRMYKLQPSMVEPISFTVPRKSDMFQDDIYPDCASDEPALDSGGWCGGKNADPKTQSLAPGFVKKEKPKKEFKPVKVEDEGPQTEAELREAYEKLKNRVSYLEAEITKKDAQIKQLGGTP